MSQKPLFITFEGTDGVGKTTQAKLLKKWLEEKKRRVVLTREPGGGKISEEIREILLNPKTKIENLTELFLYQAARIEHVEKIVRPALKTGQTVLCDRFTDATIAYQGFARGLSLKTIDSLNSIATGNLRPDLTIWLDHPPQKALRKARKKRGDRIENKGFKFQEKVRKGYQFLAKKYQKRFVRIPVRSEVMETQNDIRHLVSKRLFS